MQKKHVIAAASFWTLMIVFGCWLPASWFPPSTPDLGSSIFSFINLPLDKLIHFLMFFGFGLLWSLALGGRLTALIVLAAGLILAVVTELGQSTPLIGREADLPDGLADLVGLAAGLALAILARKCWPTQPLEVKTGKSESHPATRQPG